MEVKDAFSEARELWASASWPMRLFLTVSVFLSTSSIASMADLVFAWKGFILDGILFYRAWITEPLKQWLPLSISQTGVDALIVWSQVLIVFMKSIVGLLSNLDVLSVIRGGKRIHLDRFTVGCFGTFFVMVAGVLYVVPFLLLFIVAETMSFSWLVAWLGIGFLVKLGWDIGTATVDPEAAESISEDELNRLRRAFSFSNLLGPTVLALGLVLLLGAVNSGLTR